MYIRTRTQKMVDSKIYHTENKFLSKSNSEYALIAAKQSTSLADGGSTPKTSTYFLTPSL